jgi:nucleoside phosphorylase
MAPNIVPQPKFAEYSVGWICVQQPEFVAARAMLDAEHGVPASRNAADSNSYFLGSIGDHKVVIACLPAGAPGAASAATVAANMQRTFREVRVGLLVGVGSGAPSAADDIRLGDVVVGIPTNETGGVIQFGLAPQDDNVDGDDRSCSSSGGDGDGYGCRRSQFVRTRCLNAPPRALLSALNVLEAEHALNGSRACEYLAQAAQRSPRRKSHFTAPVACSSGGGGGDEGEKREEMDRLYQANNSHVSGSSSNVICGSCAVSMLVQRPRRDSEGPVVHYGVIASGDQEIECGIARDLAEKTLGAICFEREAAGLMDNFPCLVIRGICDYADTHKSVMWQGYAAATASTYAKELLECTPPQEVREMATIVEVMKDGEPLPSAVR